MISKQGPRAAGMRTPAGADKGGTRGRRHGIQIRNLLSEAET